MLSNEQKQILDLVKDRAESVFFTGSAGTGKSVLLREIIAQVRRKFAKEVDRVAVTASTGLAACNIGGVTLHSFAGIGLGKEDVDTLLKKIRRNQKAKHRWPRRADVLRCASAGTGQQGAMQIPLETSMRRLAGLY